MIACIFHDTSTWHVLICMYQDTAIHHFYGCWGSLVCSVFESFMRGAFVHKSQMLLFIAIKKTKKIYSSCYYHHQIGSIHLSHCYHIFPSLCAWDVCCIILCHLLHIRSGKTGSLFSSLLCSLWWVQIFGYVLACRSYSFVCTVHDLIIISVQTYLKALNFYNACQIYFVKCVSKIKHILSVIHCTICRAVCFQFTHFCCDDWENIYTLFYYHHQIGRINYYPLFRVRSGNSGVRCMSFYILMVITSSIKSDLSFDCGSIYSCLRLKRILLHRCSTYIKNVISNSYANGFILFCLVIHY